MGSDLTGDYGALRGLLIQDPRIDYSKFSPSLSTLTQAGPLPGVPVAQQDTEMLLETTGTQAASKELRVRTIESGHPDTDAARFVWRYNGDPLWRGWDSPTTISGFEFIDRSTTADYWKFPHAVTTADGKIVAVAQRQKRRIYAYTRSAAGVWGSGVEIYDRGSTYTNRASPCLVLLPSGRLLCFFWREKGSKASIWLYYSDDDGASWTVGSRAALSSSISTSTYAQKRIRAAYLDGQIILIGWLTNSTSEEIHQWASSDLGSSFQKIDSLITLNKDYGCPDVIAHNGALHVAYLYSDGTDIKPFVRRLGSAFETISSAAEVLATSAANAMQWGKILSNVYSESDLALWADEDGSMYVAGLDHDAAGGALKEMMLSRSADNGETWSTLGSSSAGNGTGSAVWFGKDANTYPRDFCAVAALGQTVMLHRFKADPGTADDSLCALTLGGYTTVEIPELDALDLALVNRAGWEITWLPFDLPNDTSWGRSASSSGADALAAEGVRITHTGTSDDIAYYVTPTQDVESMLLVQPSLSGGGPSGYVQIRTTNGTNLDVDVEITITALGVLTMTDKNSGSTLASVSGVSVLNGIQILLAVSDPTTAKASAWYRASTTSTDRQWAAIGTNKALTTGTVSSGTIRWGSVPGVVGNISYRLACATWGTYAGVGLSGGQSNPDDLLGRAIMPSPVYVDGGVSLKAADGPTFRNDQWNIDTRYEHAIDHIHTDVSPSPRRVWRSTDTTQHEIVWETSTTVSDVSQFVEDLFGVHLARVNWRTGSFWGRSSGGSWVKILDIDTASGQSGLKFTRDGCTVGPDPTGGNDGAVWWPLDCLEGCYWDNGTQIRKIHTNTPGAWLKSSTAANARQVRIVIEDHATGDLSSGSAGAIRGRDCTVVTPIEAATKYSAYKLRIDSQNTAEGYFTVGACIFGPVVVMGGEYGWGRGLSASTSIQRTQGRGGTRSARQLAPVRRAVELGWPDGLDVSGVGHATPDADFYRAFTAGPIVAGDGDALWSLRGLLGLLSRSDGLVTYIPRFPIEGSSTTVTITHREQHLYGRVMSDVHRVDNVQGEEWVDEVLRGGRIRIEEEL